MADITPAKANIDINETKFGAAVSEATMTKMGGSINWINNFVENIPLTSITVVDSAKGNLNSGTSISGTATFTVPYDMTIKGISISGSVSDGAGLTSTASCGTINKNASPITTGSFTIVSTGTASGFEYITTLGSTNSGTTTIHGFAADVTCVTGDVITIPWSLSNAGAFAAASASINAALMITRNL